MTMGFIPKPTENWPAWAVFLYYLVAAIAVLFLAIKTFMKSYVKVPQNHMGMKKRFERPRRANPYKPQDGACTICDDKRAICPVCQKGRYCLDCPECPVHDELIVVDSGFYWVIPFTHGIILISLEDDTVPLDALRFEVGADKRQYVVDGSFVYKIGRRSRDLAMAIFRAKSLEATVKAQAMKALGQACSGPSLVSDLDVISAAGVSCFTAQPDKYGVEAVRFDLKPIARSPEQVLADSMGQGNLPVGVLRAVSGE